MDEQLHYQWPKLHTQCSLKFWDAKIKKICKQNPEMEITAMPDDLKWEIDQI